MKVFIFVLTMLLVFSTHMSAQRTTNRAGQIDRSFGVNGIASTPGERVSPYAYWPVLVTPSQHVFHTYDISDIWIHGFRIVKQRPDGILWRARSAYPRFYRWCDLRRRHMGAWAAERWKAPRRCRNGCRAADIRPQGVHTAINA